MTEEQTKKGLFWRTLESVGVHGMQALIQLVLARLLLPEDFGIIAILNIFVSLANTLVQNGLGAGLLKKKTVEHKDLTSVFAVEFGISFIIYAVIFFTAPRIAEFYGNAGLTVYLRVFAVTLVIGSVSAVQTTLLRYKMDFKSSFIANFAGITVQGVAGIWMALRGYGVWSLIVSQVAYRAVTMILLTALARFFPKAEFSLKTLKELFSYSWKMLVGFIINSIYVDLFSLVFGKAYDEKTLGYYSKGITVPNVINRVFTQATAAVMFPVLARSRDDKAALLINTRGLLSVSAALVLPVMSGLAAAAEPMIKVLFTEKWLPSAPVIQIMCVAMAFCVIGNANMQSYNAVGRSGLFLTLEAVKRGAAIILIIILSKVSLTRALYAVAAVEIVSLFINAPFNKKLFGYSYKDQFIDIAPYVLLAAVIFGAAYSLNLLPASDFVIFVLQIAVCAVIYLFCVFFIKKGAFQAIKTIILDFLKKRQKTL
ncbi:MAG: lipopolysaccharide biosynthesis protein [Clostridia bacterium]|nr:lipopolysaccharide biosynthesis protein [Clostridia bacterium]